MSCCFQIFLTRNFLGCMSLRTGTFVVSATNLLSSLCFTYYALSSVFETPGDGGKVISKILIALPWGLIICGIMTSIQILCWLPTCNGGINSSKTVFYGLIDVHCLLESAICNALLAVFGTLIYAASAETYELNHKSHSFYDHRLPSIIFVVLFFGIHLYFALIVYSLYKVIYGKNKNKRNEELIPLNFVSIIQS